MLFVVISMEVWSIDGNLGKFHCLMARKLNLHLKLPTPIFDPTTKSEHDVPITKDDAIKQNLVKLDEYEWLLKIH